MSSDGWSRRRTKREVMQVRAHRRSRHPPWRGLNEMRDKLVEMQGRIGELGEMVKSTTSPSMPSHVSVQAVSTAPQTNTSFAMHEQTSSSINVHSPLSPITPTPQATGLCLPHLFLWRPPPP
jgi:hypothetical protein